MPYSRSRSRVDFNCQSRKLHSLARKISYKSHKLDYDYKNLIYQSSIFLLSAAIEEYFKNVLQDWVYELKSKRAMNKHIPSSTRTLFIVSNQVEPIKSYVFQKDDKKIINALNHSKPYYGIINDGEYIPGFFSHEVILKGKKYPSVENLKALFIRLGIPDIITILSKKGKRDFESVLKSFLNIRESIAHQTPPNLTFEDVDRNFVNINSLVNLLDRELYMHIVKSSGAKYWPCST